MQDQHQNRTPEKRPRRSSCTERPPTNAAKLNHPSSPHSNRPNNHANTTAEPPEASTKSCAPEPTSLSWPRRRSAPTNVADNHRSSDQVARKAELGSGSAGEEATGVHCSGGAGEEATGARGSGGAGEEATGALQSSSTFDELLAEAGQQVDSLQRVLGTQTSEASGSCHGYVALPAVTHSHAPRAGGCSLDNACSSRRTLHRRAAGRAEEGKRAPSVRQGRGRGRKGKEGGRGWNRSKRRAAQEAALAGESDEEAAWLPNPRSPVAESAGAASPQRGGGDREEGSSEDDEWIEAQLAQLSGHGGDASPESSKMSDAEFLENCSSDDDEDDSGQGDRDDADDEADGAHRFAYRMRLDLGRGEGLSRCGDAELNHCLFGSRRAVPSEQWLNPGSDCVVQWYRGVLLHSANATRLR